MVMRRQRLSKERRRYRSSEDNGGLALSTRRPQESTPTPKKPPYVTEAPGASETYETYLPQSADDGTVQQKAKGILDQVELHIENFYRNSSSATLRPDSAELGAFDSPYLPASLATLLPRSKNKVNIMKHALAQSMTSCISPNASPVRSLLPTEFATLPNTVASTRSKVSTKAGEYHCIPCHVAYCEGVAESAKDLPK